MAETTDFELDELPENIGPHVADLVRLWHEARAEDPEQIVPSRDILSAERLHRWLDDITIYEYMPIKEDFVVRIDAPSIVSLNRESFQRASPREIDMKYGTCLTAALFNTMMCGEPKFYHVTLAVRADQHWLRVLLPVRTRNRDRDLIDQILGIRFDYECQYHI
ncbi:MULTISPECIES: hypothetical protein [Thalassospira]|uniref:PAS domain-containing protein n=2 Tax=Thalassospira TaxID=168934 RepID=A0AB72UDK4_9PROT|nr:MULTISPECIES: hypothetical protein [Thalassospira]AJD52360.1 hypothetical protein TH3_11220 [Thalassospira xiamenensis M-5 = DSM 17429]KEO53782.1 hypothetical protein SMB34_06920 [Thalassospira permensis NBRC 106175]PTC01192.1 hypothetical protein C9975_03360 [Thalassospira xiamenensis]SIS86301.1 hypothetical protein SAMN02744133_10330 [Thalassospira xiamenensis M-5 = DSM 17429]